MRKKGEWGSSTCIEREDAEVFLPIHFLKDFLTEVNLIFVMYDTF